MRFKLDENLAPPIAALLEQAGHQVATVLTEGICGAEDGSIYRICREESRCLVTMDLDFANPLRFPPEAGAGIVVLRPRQPTFQLIRVTIVTLLDAIGRRSPEGKLWIVEPGRIREHSTP